MSRREEFQGLVLLNVEDARQMVVGRGCDR